jgi:hypothetical protein
MRLQASVLHSAAHATGTTDASSSSLLFLWQPPLLGIGLFIRNNEINLNFNDVQF